MARIIQSWSGRDVLEVVKWKEFVLIYLQSVFYNWLVICKNVLWCLKSFFENQFGPTRHIAHKFSALSLMKSNASSPKNQQSLSCPNQLMDAQLGQHKFMKLKVCMIESGSDKRKIKKVVRVIRWQAHFDT